MSVFLLLSPKPFIPLSDLDLQQQFLISFFTCSLKVVNLLLEREPTIVLEHRADSSCLPLIHSPSYSQPTSRTEVSMETTLSGRAKDYSFVTDGESKEERTNTLSHIKNMSYTYIGPRGDQVI